MNIYQIMSQINTDGDSRKAVFDALNERPGINKYRLAQVSGVTQQLTTKIVDLFKDFGIVDVEHVNGKALCTARDISGLQRAYSALKKEHETLNG